MRASIGRKFIQIKIMPKKNSHIFIRNYFKRKLLKLGVRSRRPFEKTFITKHQAVVLNCFIIIISRMNINESPTDNFSNWISHLVLPSVRRESWHILWHHFLWRRRRRWTNVLIAMQNKKFDELLLFFPLSSPLQSETAEEEEKKRKSRSSSNHNFFSLCLFLSLLVLISLRFTQ